MRKKLSGKIINRRPDWPARLFEAIEKYKHQDFVYGVFDCCLFTGSVIEAMTDYDAMADYRDHYKDKVSAESLIRSIGGLKKELTKQFGQPIPLVEVSRGDLIMVNHYTLGICTGAVAVCCSIDEGVVTEARSQWRTAWRV